MKFKYQLFILLLFFGFSAYLFYAGFDTVKKEMIRDLNVRQTAHAKQAAKGIESFFNHYLSDLKFLSQIDSIIDLDDRGRDLMRIFHNNNSDEIYGVTRVDAGGRIMSTFPFDQESIGVDISSQDHIREIMKTHQPVVSDVFEAVQGFRCIAFHVPVFRGESYAGSIAILIDFDHISKNFLEDIQIGSDGYAWLLSPKGVELYCPVPGHIGKTVYETSGRFPSVLSMADEMTLGKRGETTYTYDRLRGNIIDTLTKQAVYLPIPVINTFWSIVVATPEDEALKAMEAFNHNWILIILVMASGCIVLAYTLLKAQEMALEHDRRKKSEAALVFANRNLNDIIEFLPDATLVIDKEKKIVAWNRAMEEMTGVAKEDMIGKAGYAQTIPFYGEPRPHLLDLIDTRDEALESRYKNVKRRGRILTAETFAPALYGGKGAHIWMTGAPLFDIHGNPSGAIESIRDISERMQIEADRRKLEARLNRAEKMESLGTLAGGVAHDLNNVLGVLVGYSELLKENIPDSSPLRKYVDNIMKSGMRGAAIIQDLLTLARRGVPVSQVVNLNRVLSAFFETPEFEKLKSVHSGVTFNFHLEKNLLNITGSPVHLEKTVMNLVANAAESVSGAGQVTIQTENQYLESPIRGYDEIKEGDYVVLTVSDTGGGIPDKDIGKIFEPFYTKKVMGRSGTGLGLAVVWGTVKDHEGYINVQSEDGKGTVFTLYFPITRENLNEDKKPLSLDCYKGNGESILVVDDIKEQRELAFDMLTRLGYRVDALSSGEAALEHLKTHKADLVVLDMIMDPGMDGLETYRKILERTPDQKAVIVSGYSETDRVKTTLNLGAGTYVKKPYVMEKIGMAIRKQLDS